MNSRDYRIGFLILLTLLLAGLAASVILSMQLNTVKNTLASTKNQLYTTKGILATTRAELTATKNELHTAEGMLDATAAQLASTEEALASTKNQLSTTEGLLVTTTVELASIKSELQSTQTRLAQKEEELALYEDTWGSVVASGVRPPFLDADIVSNGSASNPTWEQLRDFLLKDKTDEKTYVPGDYMCGDFARDVHNNAELSGIRAAYVVLKLTSGYHSCNAFKTTDRGLAFINCTGLMASQHGPSNRDKIVDVGLGENYRPKSLFPELGWERRWENMGTILDVQIYW